MNKSKLTLVIDGGWFCMSRFGGIHNDFISGMVLNNASDNLYDLLCRSFFGLLWKIPEVDNVVLTMEGGSWRKSIEPPYQLGDETYKANRVSSEDEYDWNSIWKAFDEFSSKIKELGITVSKDYNIEGDDWCWYWSHYLNSLGTNVIILTADADLKQLVRYEDGIFTAWYNDKNGLVLPNNVGSSDQDIFEYQFSTIHNPILDKLRDKIRKETLIDPLSIVTQKTISGDSSDNIKSCAQVIIKKRKYGIGKKTYKRLLETVGEPKDINDFKKKFDLIACEIPRTIKMFSGYESNLIREMLDYNLKMVYLSDETIPKDIIETMKKCEYKEADIKDLKHNGYEKITKPRKMIDIDEIDLDSLFDN